MYNRELLKEILSSTNIGKLKLKNKIFMSSMARHRAEFYSCKASKLMQEYYSQRVNAGLIYSDPIYISEDSVIYKGVPGIWDDIQIDQWRRINEEVHEKEGVIFGTLSHGGRLAHPNYNGNKNPIGPSRLEESFPLNFTKEKELSFPTEEMNEGDINRVFDNFHKAAIRIKKSDFDGINLHCSSGNLLEAFIKSSTNKRIDKWGGLGGLTFIIEILKRFKDDFDEKYISIKISPLSKYNYIFEEDPALKYSELINRINNLKIGMIEIKEKEKDDEDCKEFSNCMDYLGPKIDKNIKKVSNFATKNINDAINIINSKKSDYVSCGTFYLCNPDISYNLRKNLPLIIPDKSYYYGYGREGYIN